jgi:hypothetical protein
MTVEEAESLLALILTPGSLENLYLDIDSLIEEESSE